MEQLVARWAHNPKVEGSSPSPATKYGLVAQLAERFICNEEDVGSNPTLSTKVDL